MSIDPKILEDEADALLKAANEVPPPETPTDTDTTDESGNPQNEVAGGTESDDNTPESQAPIEPDTDAPEKDTDELHGLTLENAQERIRNAQARMTRATQETAELRRSLSDAQRKLQELTTQVDQLSAKAKDEPDSRPDRDTGSQSATASLESLREEYPIIMDPLIASFNAMQVRLDAIDSDRKTEKANTAKATSQAAQGAHIQRITKTHPDLYQVVDSDDFKGWLERQPQAYSIFLFGDGIATSQYQKGGDADQIIGVLNEYKRAVGQAHKTAKAKEQGTPSMQQVRGQKQTPAQKTWTRAEIEKMPTAEYARQEAEIDIAMSEGRIV